MSKAERPLLSIGMIVKNEMRCLKRCLDALAPLREAIPCQLVIADTGSTDGTRELAAKYADELFDFEWRGDFSAARNAVLDRCSGEWYMQVDADEYLDENIAELAAFLKGKNPGGHNVVVLTVRSYNTLEMAEGDYDDFYAFRMVRMSCGARYEGTIHESLELPDKNEDSALLLSTVILHHDGYVKSIFKDKKKRNMELLEKALELNPGEIKRAVQCLESSYTAEQKLKYARLSAELAEQDDGGDPTARCWRIAAFHGAVAQTVDCDPPEFPQWVRRAKELFPDSILVNVGVSFGNGYYLAKKGDYQGCIEELDNYFLSLKRYFAGDFNRREVQVTSLTCTGKRSQDGARVLRIHCLTQLGRWPELAAAMSQLDIAGTDGEALYPTCLNGILKLWQCGQPGPEQLLRRAFAQLSSREDKAGLEKFQQLCRGAFVKSAGQQEAVFGRENWRLFAALGPDCDLGRAGLIMSAPNARVAEGLLSGLEDFDALPPEALREALRLGAALPEGFYSREAERVAAQAAELARLMLDEPKRAMAICPPGGRGEPGRALWGYTLACELAGGVDWEKNGDMGLFWYFCDMAEEYLDLFYSPGLRTEANLNALPVLARFACRCLQARSARRANDELGYVRGLRAGLKTCPGMKGMVNYLVEQAREEAERPRQAVSEELAELAAQVRAILAMYPEGHPMVEQIKATPAYKQVAGLIEGGE